MEDLFIATLKRAQDAQVRVAMLNNGHSLHIDLGSYKNVFGEGFHASFSVTLFSETGIDADWDFNEGDDRDILIHNIEDLEFHIGRL